MLDFNIQESLSLLRCVNYSYTQKTCFNFENEPRPYHNLAFISDGSGIIYYKGEKIVVSKGDILYIPKNATYNAVWVAQPTVSFTTLHFNFQARLDPLLNKSIEVQKITSPDFEFLFGLAKQIYQNQNKKGGSAFITLASFYNICGAVLPLVKMSDVSTTNKTIYPAISYIESNFNQPVTVEFLSNLCFLSPSRFYFLFKQNTGLSPIVYKNKVAIQNATQELLFNKDLSVREIAHKNGFESLIYFERLFKKVTGKTPSQSRNQQTTL